VVPEAELIVDLRRAEAVTAAWDELAVARGLPMSAPAWMLGWWRHVAPRSAELRIIAVRDHNRIVGIVPLYVDLGRRLGARSYRLLAHDLASVAGPLAQADFEWEIAEVAAKLLDTRELRPDLLELGPIPASSVWGIALRERWPAAMRPLAHRRVLPVPVASLQGRTFDAWLSERSAHFRANLRRRHRLFEQAGGNYRFTDRASVRADIATFADLHARRWESRGSSRLVALGDRLHALLAEVAGTLLDDARFRLLMLELTGDPISAELCFAAGGEVVTFNFGWDEQHRRLSPPLLSLLRTIEYACTRGERRVDLGWGGNTYKDRFANGTDAVMWETLVPPGIQLARGLPCALPAIVGARARDSAKRLVPQTRVAQLRELRAAIRAGAGGA
jgi:CelD/BcsL family acetyltransferase involved in cellulose biosynthesis